MTTEDHAQCDDDLWGWNLESTVECFETVALTDPTYDRRWHIEAEHADDFERALRVPYRREPHTTVGADGALYVVFHRLEHWLH